MKYGEKEIVDFNIDDAHNYWPSEHDKNYTVTIELPEFMCKCPRSGYPDFAKLTLQYVPNEKVIELKALKLYINSFMNREISHENGANEIYDALYRNLQPKKMKLIADYNPRGNVHTIITIDSEENK
ncbi:MAG: NADPH-dependent 7-cyano-7-deazaguanine reductase QueF [Campylobacterales bacterium]|nr:NADPH-dependent 7-cyano-7-deazaguanine reductase QueF [Campylobacterales bacterium]